MYIASWTNPTLCILVWLQQKEIYTHMYIYIHLYIYIYIYNLFIFPYVQVYSIQSLTADRQPCIVVQKCTGKKCTLEVVEKHCASNGVRGNTLLLNVVPAACTVRLSFYFVLFI